jgi:SAM-dependent methyltransferase
VEQSRQKGAIVNGTSLLNEVKTRYKYLDSSIYSSETHGYWSNLTRKESNHLSDALKTANSREAIHKIRPDLFDVIFSEQRSVGLELLELSGDETCIDYGCMWGALTIPLAKRCRCVLGIDQTSDSLIFLRARIKENNLQNVELLCEDLKKTPVFQSKTDVAIVNGVLEWIPEDGDIELSRYYGRRQTRHYEGNPRAKQMSFLRTVCNNLKSGGKLYLAIENRYDFKQFFGVKDPHAGIRFVSILPRFLSDIISKAKLGRPYVNWLYSFNGLKTLLHDAGFNTVELYATFPHYSFPQAIVPYSLGLRHYIPTVKRRIGRIVEKILFSYLKLRYFAPSIIAVAIK